MKKIIILFLSFLPSLVWAQNNFTIKAKIGEKNAPAKVYMLYQLNGKAMSDSSTINNGTAQLVGYIKEPVLVQLVVDPLGSKTVIDLSSADVKSFYLEKGQILLNTNDSIKNATVAGSVTNDEYNSYEKSIRELKTVKSVLNTSYRNASMRKDTALTKSLDERINEINNKIFIINENFIMRNPNSYVSLDLFKQIVGPDINVSKIEPIFNHLSEEMRSTTRGQAYAELIRSARATSIGETAPLFSQNDVNDRPVNLIDFRGKYVLIDFWASWCGPCRAENPNVKVAYEKYKNKNFTVIGISLDQPGKKAAWLEAIKTDGLPWTELSDLKSWNNDVAKQYGIHSIPQNFLLDPSGKIIGKNLRGDALNNKLMEVLGL